MSKYTTELRFICEDLAGLDESVDGSEVESVIENARPKIFNFDYPIFDSAYKSVLETKIIKHFYTREIGLETFGLWKLKLNTKMNEIMPYYNLYYQSALLNFNPLYTKDLYRKKDVTIENTDELLNTTATNSISNSTSSSEVENEETSTNTIAENNITTVSGSSSTSTENDVTTSISASESGEASSDTTNRDLYSDTPQGSLTGVENQNYLTNARKITNEGDNSYSIDKSESDTTSNDTETETSESSTKSSSISANNSYSTDASSSANITNEIEASITNNTVQSKDGNSVEDYLEHVYGFESGSASKLLMDYRKTFINVDMMIINDLEELFMQLW